MIYTYIHTHIHTYIISGCALCAQLIHVSIKKALLAKGCMNVNCLMFLCLQKDLYDC